MPLVVAFMAQSHQIAPYEPQGRILSDWHYVVDLGAGSGPAVLVAVFTERVELTVACRQLVPSMIIVTPSTTLALIAFTSAVVVALRAYLLHVFMSCVLKSTPPRHPPRPNKKSPPESDRLCV